MDGKAVDPKNYTTAEGSLVVTLKASYLETLAAGDHKLVATFDDGEGRAAFKVSEKKSSDKATPLKPVNTNTGKATAPKTGDPGTLLLWLAAGCAALLVLLAAAALRRR